MELEAWSENNEAVPTQVNDEFLVSKEKITIISRIAAAIFAVLFFPITLIGLGLIFISKTHAVKASQISASDTQFINNRKKHLNIIPTFRIEL